MHVQENLQKLNSAVEVARGACTEARTQLQAQLRDTKEPGASETAPRAVMGCFALRRETEGRLPEAPQGLPPRLQTPWTSRI